ncbi:hypothetical protein LCGC14_3001990, partial [marine sediment metagenome]
MALTDSMTAYWSLEDNAANTTVVDDHSTNDGTASTNTTNLNVTGKVNDGMHFDGSSENINMGNYNDMKTISFWFKVGDSSGGDIFIAGERLRSTELAGDWDCRIFNDGTIVIDWFTPTGKFVQGSVAVTPILATIVTTVVNPIEIRSSISITSVIASAIADVLDPTDVANSLSITPVLAAAVTDVVDPSVLIEGAGLSVTPTVASAVTSTINPTIERGSISITPELAIAYTDT